MPRLRRDTPAPGSLPAFGIGTSLGPASGFCLAALVACAGGFGAGAASAYARPLPAPEWSGYAESLQSAAFADDLDSLVAGELIHARLRLRWQPLDALTFDAEARNRIYLGETAESVSDAGGDAGWVDATWVPLRERRALWILAADRAWAEWEAESWTLTMGRQRVNWGVALAWNPNDLFNTYDFLDFDYAERPGSDAIRWQFFPTWPVRFDLAVKADSSRAGVGALRAAWNVWETDFQALAGWYHDDAALGAGAAGNLGQAGWKAEGTGFVPSDGRGPRSLAVTLTVDYSLASGTYVAGSALYNARGRGAVSGLLDATAGGGLLSPENPFPGAWAFLAQVSHPFSLILTGSLSLLESPDLEAAALLPSLACNLAADWDVEGVAQLFATYGHARGWKDTGWRSEGNAFYLRLRRSF